MSDQTESNTFVFHGAFPAELNPMAEDSQLRPDAWCTGDLIAENEQLKEKVNAFKAALSEYHLALDKREHAGSAVHTLAEEVELILRTPWVQGKELNMVEKLTTCTSMCSAFGKRCRCKAEAVL